MNNFTALIPVIYSTKLIKKFWDITIYKAVTNTDYEGEIKNAGDRVKVRNLENIEWNDYTREMNLVRQALNPTAEFLIIDQEKYSSFGVDLVDEKQSDIPAVQKYSESSAKTLAEIIDADVTDYASKNFDGDSVLGNAYSTGTVEVADVTGVVTGSGTTFTADMVGGYFKADGHTDYYLVTTFTDATHITVTDLGGTTYTGGAIASGASFVINGATAVSLTASNVYQYMVDLGTALGKKKAPRDGRFIVVNPQFEGLLRKADVITAPVDQAYKGVVVNGYIGRVAGFDIYVTNTIAGSDTDGFWFWAGTKGYLSFAMQLLNTEYVPSSSNPNQFVGTMKSLAVWGRKVFSGYRGLGAGLRGKIS